MKVQALTLADTIDAAFCAPRRDQDGPWLPVKRETFFSPGPHHAATQGFYDVITIREEESAPAMPDSRDFRTPAEILQLYARGLWGGVVLHCPPPKGLRLDTWA